MDQQKLWAPWRLGYVSGEGSQENGTEASQQLKPVLLDQADLLAGADCNCFLCQAAAEPKEQNADQQNLVVWRRKDCVAVLNKFPYTNGHLLVSPRQHVGEFQQIPTSVHAEITETIAELLSILKETFKASGFNVGLNLGEVAGAGVPGHLHWHIVPRWPGDNNFMPTLAGIRVISQSLESAWEILHAEITKRN